MNNFLDTLTIGDLIATFALILSFYAIRKTTSFNRKQEKLIKSQEELNNLLLNKELADVKKSIKADLGATFITIGSKERRLKIWNKGSSIARNVRIEFPQGNQILLQKEIDENFPLEVLEQFQSIELIASSSINTSKKHIFKLIWEDDANPENSKIVYPTL
ncbi:hypothetical protein [Psychrobacter frigidicola]|uniref:hypothetical protein n=1 Tax=Psychrobacter frigidicola TaxID=45611 RepID=UPI0019197321|nr:hypothetical protein [Psychrobacter frigidicola]